MKIKYNTRLLINVTTNEWWFLTEKEIKEKLMIKDIEFKWCYKNTKLIGEYLVLDINKKAIEEFVSEYS